MGSEMCIRDSFRVCRGGVQRATGAPKVDHEEKRSIDSRSFQRFSQRIGDDLQIVGLVGALELVTCSRRQIALPDEHGLPAGRTEARSKGGWTG